MIEISEENKNFRQGLEAVVWFTQTLIKSIPEITLKTHTHTWKYNIWENGEDRVKKNGVKSVQYN